MLAVTLFLALLQAPPAPLNSISVAYPNRAYLLSGDCDVQRVDFRNFVYFTGEWMAGEKTPKPEHPLRLVRGAYHQQEMGGFEDLTVEELVRPDPSAAAVYLLHSYGGGSSNQELVVLVFQCVDGRLRNTQLIHGDGHGWGAGVFFTKDRLGMTMLSVDDYSTGHCCPRFLETAKFRWAKNKYALRASAVRENHY